MVRGLVFVICALSVFLLTACARQVITTSKEAQPDPETGAVRYTLEGYRTLPSIDGTYVPREELTEVRTLDPGEAWVVKCFEPATVGEPLAGACFSAGVNWRSWGQALSTLAASAVVLLAAFVFAGRLRVPAAQPVAVPVAADGQSLFTRAALEKRASAPAFLEQLRRSQLPVIRRVGLGGVALTLLPAVALGTVAGFPEAGEWALITAGVLVAVGSLLYLVTTMSGRGATFAVFERSVFVTGAAVGLALAWGFNVVVAGMVIAR